MSFREQDCRKLLGLCLQIVMLLGIPRQQVLEDSAVGWIGHFPNSLIRLSKKKKKKQRKSFKLALRLLN